MLEHKPIKLPLDPSDEEILRYALISELDAVNTYEQLSQSTDNKDLQIIIEDIIKEEKLHIGELQSFLIKLDEDQANQMIEGSNEVRLLTGND